MKNQFKLFLLALALLLVVACIASCDLLGGGGDTTSATTTAPTTTTVTTTEASVGATLSPEELAKIYFDVDDVTYMGKKLTSAQVGVNKPSYLDAKLSFKLVDPQTGAVIEDLGETYPTNVGTYEVTATFSWKKSAASKYANTALPEPEVGSFKIVPADASKVGSFKAVDVTMFSYPNMEYDPSNAEGEYSVMGGTLPTGINIAGVTVKKVKDDTGATVNETVANGIITGAGTYEIAISFSQTGANYKPETLTDKTCTVTVEQCSNQILQYNGVVLDGQIDAAYLDSAHLISRNQQVSKNGTTYVLNAGDDGRVVDPMKEIPLISVHRGSKAEEAGRTQSTLNVNVYALWGNYVDPVTEQVVDSDPSTTAIDPWVFLAVEVTDTTDYYRAEWYTESPNPWINDSIEVFYSFGGYKDPGMHMNVDSTGLQRLPEKSYPTYKAVTNHSSGAFIANEPSAVSAQKSFYFDNILYAAGDNRTRGEEAANEGNPVTYVCEYAFPAKSESYTGAPGLGYAQFGSDEAMEAGEFIFLAFQFNDLMGTESSPLAPAGQT
ncbi:MAG: hypothetical protein IJF73_00020, partial [Clostridia bacterium]|nr:hypothetical protein [Clostridia bacterium]